MYHDQMPDAKVVSFWRGLLPVTWLMECAAEEALDTARALQDWTWRLDDDPFAGRA